MNDGAGDRIPGDREVEELLERYAERRLRPDPAAARAVRAHLVARAAAEHLAPDAAPAGGSAAGWRQRRRITATLVGIAAVVVIAGGALATTGPGGPLYGFRLWVEEALLPPDPATRADVELDQLDARFDETLAALAISDEDAAAAALGAYVGELEDALDAAKADPGSLAAIEASVAAHLAVLEGLLDEAPQAALPGLRNAIERSGRVLDRLRAVEPGKPSEPPGKPSEPPGKPSQPPGKPSEPPGKPSQPPGKPSEPPGKPSAAPVP
jgi:hypothetical protein